MHTTLTCLAGEHDPGLSALALVICLAGTAAAFILGEEMFRASTPQRRWFWGGAGVLAAAATAWSTHFIAMLAFDPGLPARFAVPVTLLSFLCAAALIAAGAATAASSRSRAGRAAGGALAGLGIPLMHYVGMAALIVQGRARYDAGLVVASVISAATLSALAAHCGFSRRRALRRCAPLLLALAVCVTHTLGMAALHLSFDPRLPAVTQGAGRGVLAILTANAATAVIGAALAALWLDLRARRAIADEENRLNHFADVAVEGLLICDRAGRVVSSNASFEHMCGASRTTLTGRFATELLPDVSIARLPPGHEIDAVLAAAPEPVPVRVSTKPIFIGPVPHTVIAVRDQRERLRNEAEMRRLANCDALTGLGNRRSYLDYIVSRLEARRRGDDSFALLTVDLDRFKLINDTLGHGVGDEVLRRVARRLQHAIRKDDMIARLGGDEFAIVTSEPAELATVQLLAERVVDLLCRPMIVEGNVIQIGGSVGIALYPEDGTTADALARCADLALYRAKEEGRCTFRMFEAGMNARMQARRTLEQDLRRAVSREEFEVHYQPQADSPTGRFGGAEALIRWHHPVRGLVPPSDFIPLAEETGLINAIGEWVLRRACRDATAWPQHITLAVNLSPIQLRNPRIVETVSAILDETGLPGTRLELEVTETALLNDDGNAFAKLSALRDLGIAISMDDFGTGYSSLSYLRRFPFDRIKVDRSFVSQLPADEDSAAIVSAVATLGGKLGLKITAEGVETAAQRDFVARHGCGDMQGFLISQPLPASDIAALFKAATEDAELAAV